MINLRIGKKINQTVVETIIGRGKRDRGAVRSRESDGYIGQGSKRTIELIKCQNLRSRRWTIVVVGNSPAIVGNMKRNLRSGEIERFDFRHRRHGNRLRRDALHQKEKHASPQPEAQTSYLHQMSFLIAV